MTKSFKIIIEKVLILAWTVEASTKSTTDTSRVFPGCSQGISIVAESLPDELAFELGDHFPPLILLSLAAATLVIHVG